MNKSSLLVPERCCLRDLVRSDICATLAQRKTPLGNERWRICSTYGGATRTLRYCKRLNNV